MFEKLPLSYPTLSFMMNAYIYLLGDDLRNHIINDLPIIFSNSTIINIRQMTIIFPVQNGKKIKFGW
jgi:hypothetical protein